MAQLMNAIDGNISQISAGSPINNSDEIDTLVSGFLTELSTLSLEISPVELPEILGETPVANETTLPTPKGEVSRIVKRRDLKSPFCPGFSRNREPEGFILGDASELLSTIAYSEGNANLVSFIRTPRGQARVRALCYLAEGDPNTYVVLASSFARETPDRHVELLLQTIEDRLGKSEEERNVYGRITDLDLENAAICLLRCWALYKSGRYEEALSFCDQSIQLDPDGVQAWCYRSSILLGLHRPEEALHCCEQAIKLDSNDSFAWMTRGMILDGLGCRNESVAAFEKAISLGEDSPHGYFKRAQILLDLDRWREGVSLLDEALSRFGSSNYPAAGTTRDLIRNLLSRLFAPRILQLSIKVLLLVYRKRNALSALGRGLMDCIPDVVSLTALSDADAVLWRDSWKTAAEPCPQFRLTLRFLDLAVRYRKNRDRGIFMDLPQEERKAIEPLIGLY